MMTDGARVVDELQQGGYAVRPLSFNYQNAKTAALRAGLLVITSITDTRPPERQFILVGTETDGIFDDSIIDSASMTKMERRSLERVRAYWTARQENPQ